MHSGKGIGEGWLISQRENMKKCSETNTEEACRKQGNDSCTLLTERDSTGAT